jgi:hypothetical protein
MTSVITPASYPKRNDPVAAKIARATLKSSPMVRYLPRRPGGSEENDIQTREEGEIDIIAVMRAEDLLPWPRCHGISTWSGMEE